jgi:NHLM bacteriocin system ABC transporter ATP-binding protein
MSERLAGNELVHQAKPAPAGAPARIALDPRHPVLLNEHDRVLELAVGHVDIFAVETGKRNGMRHHLFRVVPGQIVLDLHSGCEKSGSRLQIVAIGSPGAELSSIARSEIPSPNAVSGWVACVAGIASHPPRADDCPELIAGERRQMQPGECCRGPMRSLVWAHVEAGAAKLFELDPAWPHGLVIPLSAGLWLATGEHGCVLVADAEMPAPPSLWAALDQLHVAVVVDLERRLGLGQLEERQRLLRRTELIHAQSLDSLGRLSETVSKTSKRTQFELDASDPLLSSCRAVGEALGSSIAHSSRSHPLGETFSDILEIARANRLRVRRVQLRDRWWKVDAGPLLAWYGNTRDPVALIPDGRNRYAILDPKHGRLHRVDRSVAKDLAPDAVSFYKVLPARPLGYRDLLSFSTGGLAGSFVRIALTVIAIGLLSLVLPLLTNLLVSSVIPRTETDQLIVFAAALCVTAIAIASLQGMQGLVTLRLEGLLDYRLQAALADRMLKLPASLFRDFTTGDLVDRSMGIEAARQILTGRVLRGFTAALFGFFSIGLMLYYDPKLGGIAFVLTALRVLAILAAGALRVYYEIKHFNLQGKINGFVLQLIAGVGKLRVANATARGFAQWSRQFSVQKRYFIASQRTGNFMTVFETSFPTLATLVIFAVASHGNSQLLTNLGAFLGFLAAFGQASAAAGNWASSTSESLAAIPHLMRLRPVISAAVEIEENRREPGQLSGEIEFSGVVFRYIDGGPKVLDDVTFRIAPGELVAIVGPSGSGKSSLLRLLLGFERPESGSIFYDGKALNTLDISAVRRQLGVVLQDTRLATGSLYENICGGVELSLDRAWDAARAAALDADIREMPMGMNTLVAEGINTLSGGQRQRLLIARAIARSPKILLFDEATSALDNQTQAIVGASLERLSVTRIVIAHRLSTIRNADRILMLVGGEIVQSGSYDQLMKSGGPFADFARRQLLCA